MKKKLTTKQKQPNKNNQTKTAKQPNKKTINKQKQTKTNN